MRLEKRINIKCESDKWSGSFLWENIMIIKYDYEIVLKKILYNRNEGRECMSHMWDENENHR